MSEELIEAPARRIFESGAMRDTDAGKPDYEGFLSPLVIEAFGRYMSKNRLMADGTIRDSDNWQKGIPLPAYMKSGWRHVLEWWKLHRGYEAGVDVEDAICGVLFNAMGYLHEHLIGQFKQQQQCEASGESDKQGCPHRLRIGTGRPRRLQRRGHTL